MMKSTFSSLAALIKASTRSCPPGTSGAWKSDAIANLTGTSFFSQEAITSPIAATAKHKYADFK